MRIPKTFGQRATTKTSNEVRRKYFLVFEGSETEVQYFNGIRDNMVAIGVNPLIDIKPLLRSYNEMGWSNPKKILNRLIEYIDEGNSGLLTINSIISKSVDYLLEEGVISNNSLYSAYDIHEILTTNILTINTGDELVQDIGCIAKEICDCLNEKASIIKAVEYLNEYFNKQYITYEAGFDKICIIVDRDKDSFVALPYNDQFEYVKNKCIEKGFGFYLTNPCFEFWLLMHFDEVHNYDRNILLDNPKITKKKRYTQIELAKLLHGYKKKDVKFYLLKNRVDKAILNEKSFCEDIDLLKTQLGCNIGILMQELKGNNINT